MDKKRKAIWKYHHVDITCGRSTGTYVTFSSSDPIRSYGKPTRASLLRLSLLISRNNINLSMVAGQENITTWFIVNRHRQPKRNLLAS